jgi:predicted anti-sigma-YlaC factor YlaD
MQCERAQEFFSDYLEATLDRPMTVALEAHLAGCADCREECEALQEVMQALSAVPAVEPPRAGAAQVMQALQQLREQERAVPREPAISFLEWLRSLSPMRLAMGSALATLVVAGLVLVPWVPHRMLIGVPWAPPVNPVQKAAVPAATAPLVHVTSGQVANGMRDVQFTVTPATDLPDGRVTVLVGSSKWNVEQALGAKAPLRIQVPVPQSVSGPLVVRLVVESPTLQRQYPYLVVLPLDGHGGQPVTLSFTDQPLEEALRRVAPYLSRPVVVEGGPESPATLLVDDVAGDRALEQIAASSGYEVRLNGDVYRLVPVR